MTFDPRNDGFAARLTARGFAFSVRRFIDPVIHRGQALVSEMQARSLRRKGQAEIDELPDYLRLDIGMPRASGSGNHHER